MTVLPIQIQLLSYTRCRVYAPPREVLGALDKEFSYPVKGAKFSTRFKKKLWDGKKHCFSLRTGVFPFGLLGRVLTFLETSGYEIEIEDLRAKKDLPVATPEFIASIGVDYLEGVTLRDYQREAIQTALYEKNGILWCSTNSGKTLMAAGIIQAYGQIAAIEHVEYNVLFLVPGRSNQLQAQRMIAGYLGWKTEDIGLLGDGHFTIKQVTVAIVAALRPKDPDKKRALRECFSRCTLLIQDETHHGKAATHYAVTQSINAPYRIGLSGTPFTGVDDLLVEATFGHPIYRITNEELIKRGVSARPLIEILPISEPICKLSGYYYGEVYRLCIVENELRNEMIADKIEQRIKESRPTLVIVDRISHGDRICQLLVERGIDFEFVFGAGTKTEDIERKAGKFERGEVSVLIASPLFDEARDIKAARALILASGHKAIRQILQRIGRGLRQKTGDNTLYITDFADLTHPLLAQHSLDRLAIYESENFDVL